MIILIMGNITVPAYATIDIKNSKDFHITFTVTGDTPEEQKTAADAYAKKWAEFNHLNARTIETFIGVPEGQISKIRDWVKAEFS